MPSALPVQVTCPACGTKFVTQVHTVVDVGSEPELKEALLQGKLNAATCPNCGQSGMLSMPFLYHDPDKELLLVHVPDQLSLKVEEREKLVGDLVNALMTSLPPEKRKAYLFQPETFLSLQRLMEAVLRGDGITQEMIDAQRKALSLMQEMMSAQDDEERLAELVEEHKEELDYQFFLLLSASVEAAEGEGETEYAEGLKELRNKLLSLINVPIPEPLPQDTSKDELIDKLLEAEDEEHLQVLLISNRPMVDYSFYQALTSRIEAAETEGKPEDAASLAELRTKVLEITDEMDKQAREAQQQVVALVEELLASDDLDAAINEHLTEYDTLFFLVLGGLMQAAERGGESERLSKLRHLEERVAALLEEAMPPEFRLIGSLLDAEYPDETEAILSEHAHEVTPDLVDTMKAILASWQESDRADDAAKLEGIIEQASRLLPG